MEIIEHISHFQLSIFSLIFLEKCYLKIEVKFSILHLSNKLKLFIFTSPLLRGEIKNKLHFNLVRKSKILYIYHHSIFKHFFGN
jgi:hypothetical protein